MHTSTLHAIAAVAQVAGRTSTTTWRTWLGAPQPAMHHSILGCDCTGGEHQLEGAQFSSAGERSSGVCHRLP
eukprot:1939017-Karenia_brevis.AAC.1